MSQQKSHSGKSKARRGGSNGKTIAKRYWGFWPKLLVFAVIAGAALTAMTVTGQDRGEPVADFTVKTALGPLANQKGNVLIYFFSFPG